LSNDCDKFLSGAVAVQSQEHGNNKDDVALSCDSSGCFEVKSTMLEQLFKPLDGKAVSDTSAMEVSSCPLVLVVHKGNLPFSVFIVFYVNKWS